MIIDYSEPLQTKSGIWELRIRVRGKYEIYTQIVTFETLASANKYIEYIKIAKSQRGR